ncbi:MAG: hypothetical protein J0H49_09255 [Acidobacteria bacterium]|nr:hypothetical protein [Acidobacteriota bacterium]
MLEVAHGITQLRGFTRRPSMALSGVIPLREALYRINQSVKANFKLTLLRINLLAGGTFMLARPVDNCALLQFCSTHRVNAGKHLKGEKDCLQHVRTSSVVRASC